MIESPAGILLVLTAVVGFFFFLEKHFRWKLFQYFPPLIFIYLVPVLLSNTGRIPHASVIYTGLEDYALPMFITLMLLEIDVKGVIRVLGRGVLVMLMGTVGVVLGAPLAYAIFRNQLGPDAWKAFGALAGSWIGGTGNMAAISDGIGTPPAEFGMAVIADNLVYIVWLPLLLASRAWAKKFERFTGSDPDRVAKMEAALDDLSKKSKEVEMHHLIYLLFIALGATLLARSLAPLLPVIPPVLSTGTWRILIVTTLGILLSFTPARRIPGSHPLAMAIIYLFVARMGATSDVAGLTQAPIFVAAAYVWIAIHGLFCLLGARIFRVDIHTAAIASAANIGGAASAPIVAGYHRETLIPMAILMAIVGYAVGNFLGFATALLCYWVSTI